MRVLCSMPGKLGDIMWALPTVREIARQVGEPVDLVIGAPYSSLLELLKLQPYIRLAWAEENWQVLNTAPMTPRECPLQEDQRRFYDKVYHLGYEGWPEKELPIETFYRALQQGAFQDNASAGLRANDPWITLPPIHQPSRQDIYLGWSDEWFELKFGLCVLLQSNFPDQDFLMRQPQGSRWMSEGNVATEPDEPIVGAGWLGTAKALSSCKLYVGCLSAQWVLANALGVPCCVVEPNPHRHNPIFWWDGPVEKDGRPRNRMVLGNDGKPTFDARATVQAVQEELARER